MPTPQIPFGLDKKILERGYWIATHRLMIERLVAIGLYIIITALYALFFTQFGLYLYHSDEWEDLVRSMVISNRQWQDIHERNAPKDLELSEPSLFSLGNNQYNVIVEAFNANEQWAIEALAARFVFETGEEARREIFILPGERRYISVLNYQASAPITAVEFSIESQRWRKVPKLPALCWEFTDPPTFTGYRIISERGKQTTIPARVTWTVQNCSTLSIRQVLWQVALYSGDRLAGFVEYQSEGFPFHVERHFDIVVRNVAGRVSKTYVFPIVNIFDPDFTYLPNPTD